jgi:hypothetical protein
LLSLLLFGSGFTAKPAESEMAEGGRSLPAARSVTLAHTHGVARPLSHNRSLTRGPSPLLFLTQTAAQNHL